MFMVWEWWRYISFWTYLGSFILHVILHDEPCSDGRRQASQRCPAKSLAALFGARPDSGGVGQ